MWAAIHALSAAPGRRIAIVEAGDVGCGASTRNGGMVDASIAHGAENAHRHWPDELDLIVRLGDQNFADLQQCLIDHHIDARHEQSTQTHGALAQQFFSTFPQLEGLDFTHRWGGPIAATSRFTCAWGQRFDDRLAWVGGYTGLGVAASCFGAQVALDLVDSVETERTELKMVRSKPFPFPPEPLRSAVVGITKKSIQRADERQGCENVWLKFLSRLGIGFDT